MSSPVHKIREVPDNGAGANVPSTVEVESNVELPGQGDDSELTFHGQSEDQLGSNEGGGGGDDIENGTGNHLHSFSDFGHGNKRYSSAGVIPMAKRYHLFSCIALIICNVIGAGVFINPQDVYKNTESTGISLIIWLGMGLHTTLGALSYAELGTTLPLSGGDYAYLTESFGPFVGFEFQWCANLLFIPAVNAILALTVGKYFLELVCIYACYTGQNSAHYFGEENYNWWATLIGFIFVVIITTVNCLSTKFAEVMQNILTVAKLTACAMVVLLGITQLARTGRFNSPLNFGLNKGHDNFGNHANDISIAIYEVSFSYLGWNCLNYITEELENPYKNLPRAILISIPVITVIYVIMNFSYFAVLSHHQLSETSGIASDCLNTVLGDLKEEIGWIAPLIIMISAFGGLACHMMALSRVSFVGSRQRQLPLMFNQIHKIRLTPIPALLLQGILTTLFLIVQQNVVIIVMSVYCENFFSSLAVVGLVYLRFKEPGLDRPIKFFIGIPMFFILTSFIIFIIPILAMFRDEADLKRSVPVVMGPVLLFIIGIPFYIYFIGRHSYLDRLPKWLYNPGCQQSLDEKVSDGMDKIFNLKKGE